VHGDGQGRRLIPRTSRIRLRTVQRPACPIRSRIILNGDPADEPFRGSQMGAQGSGVRVGIVWMGPASERRLGWGGERAVEEDGERLRGG
jgi:hypothetical protein